VGIEATKRATCKIQVMWESLPAGTLSERWSAVREQHGTVAAEHCGQAVDRQSARSERSVTRVMLEEEAEVCMYAECPRVM
jgi:hypothetical protein